MSDRVDADVLRSDVAKEIRSCLVPAKGGSTVQELQREYREQVGRDIPWRQLGHPSLESFLAQGRDFCRASRPLGPNGPIVLHPVTADSAHLVKLVAGQKPAPKKNCLRPSFPSHSPMIRPGWQPPSASPARSFSWRQQQQPSASHSSSNGDPQDFLPRRFHGLNLTLPPRPPSPFFQEPRPEEQHRPEEPHAHQDEIRPQDIDPQEGYPQDTRPNDILQQDVRLQEAYRQNDDRADDPPQAAQKRPEQPLFLPPHRRLRQPNQPDPSPQPPKSDPQSQPDKIEVKVDVNDDARVVVVAASAGRIRWPAELRQAQKEQEPHQFMYKEYLQQKVMAEQQRLAEEQRLEEEKRLQEELKLAEEHRLQEEKRLLEEQRLQEEKRLQEEQRLQQTKRQEMLLQKERLLQEQVQLEQEKLLQQQKLLRERRVLEEEKRREEQRLREVMLQQEEQLLQEQKLQREREKIKELEAVKEAKQLIEQKLLQEQQEQEKVQREQAAQQHKEQVQQQLKQQVQDLLKVSPPPRIEQPQKVFSSTVQDLRQFCFESSLGEPQFNTSKMRNGRCVSSVVVGGLRFQTFPEEFLTMNAAEDAAAKVALRELMDRQRDGSAAYVAESSVSHSTFVQFSAGDSSTYIAHSSVAHSSSLGLPSADNSSTYMALSSVEESSTAHSSIADLSMLVDRIAAVVGNRTNGLFSSYVEAEYKRAHGEELPGGWAEVVGSMTGCKLRVDPSLMPGSFIVLPNPINDPRKSAPSFPPQNAAPGLEDARSQIPTLFSPGLLRSETEFLRR